MAVMHFWFQWRKSDYSLNIIKTITRRPWELIYICTIPRGSWNIMDIYPFFRTTFLDLWLSTKAILKDFFFNGCKRGGKLWAGFKSEIRPNAFHRFPTLGRLLENERFCLDKVGKKQMDKLDCFIGYSHLLPGCFGLSVSHGNVATPAQRVCVYVVGDMILILFLCLLMCVHFLLFLCAMKCPAVWLC